LLRENVFARPTELVGEGEGTFGVYVFINTYIYINFFKSETEKLVLFSLLPSLLKIERIPSPCLLLFSITCGSQQKPFRLSFLNMKHSMLGEAVWRKKRRHKRLLWWIFRTVKGSFAYLLKLCIAPSALCMSIVMGTFEFTDEWMVMRLVFYLRSLLLFPFCLGVWGDAVLLVASEAEYSCISSWKFGSRNF